MIHVVSCHTSAEYGTGVSFRAGKGLETLQGVLTAIPTSSGRQSTTASLVLGS